MTLQEIIDNSGLKVWNGTLSLGYENGWSESRYALYKSLKPFWIDSTYGRSGPASDQSMSVFLEDGDLKILLKWQLDSGD